MGRQRERAVLKTTLRVLAGAVRRLQTLCRLFFGGGGKGIHRQVWKDGRGECEERRGEQEGGPDLWTRGGGSRLLDDPLFSIESGTATKRRWQYDGAPQTKRAEVQLGILPRIQRILIRFTKGSPGERQASMIDGGRAVVSSMGIGGRPAR